MKKGRNLSELASEITRQATSKRDFVAPTTELSMQFVGNQKPWQDPAVIPDPKQKELRIHINSQGLFGIRQTAHEQFASRLGIPKAYYDRMRASSPDLLSSNVNHWLRTSEEKRMVRTLDGNVRAFLSDRYRPLDNFDLAEAVLPSLSQPGYSIESMELTDSKLYIKVVTEKLKGEVRKGDVVQAGICISNSEIGHGSVKIEPLINRLACLNGMISNDHAMRKYHVGRGNGEGDLAQEFFRDETRQAADKAFWMKVKDVVEGSFRQDVFDAIVNSMRDATERKVTGDPVKVVEVTQKHFGLNETEKSGVLRHLIISGDLTQYGLMNAVTRTSQDVDNYDRATDLERMGGQIIELGKTDWKTIAEAA